MVAYLGTNSFIEFVKWHIAATEKQSLIIDAASYQVSTNRAMAVRTSRQGWCYILTGGLAYEEDYVTALKKGWILLRNKVYRERTKEGRCIQWLLALDGKIEIRTIHKILLDYSPLVSPLYSKEGELLIINKLSPSSEARGVGEFMCIKDTDAR